MHTRKAPILWNSQKLNKKFIIKMLSLKLNYRENSIDAIKNLFLGRFWLNYLQSYIITICLWCILIGHSILVIQSFQEEQWWTWDKCRVLSFYIVYCPFSSTYNVHDENRLNPTPAILGATTDASLCGDQGVPQLPDQGRPEQHQVRPQQHRVHDGRHTRLPASPY